MGEWMTSLPAVAAPGKRPIAVELITSACTDRRLSRSCGGGSSQVESCLGRDGDFTALAPMYRLPTDTGTIYKFGKGKPLGRENHCFALTGNSYSSADVRVGSLPAFADPELHSVLELASDAELLDLSNILYGRSFMSPLLKSLTPGDGSSADHDGQPPKTQADRDALMIRLEARFLFLAADAKATLSGRRPSYRNVLLQVRRRLQIPCAANLSSADMESEIFLHLLQYSRKPIEPQVASQKSPAAGGKKRRWRIGLPTVVTLRGKELLSTFLKGGGAVTVSTLQRMVFKRLAGKLLLETARYQLAKEAVVKTGQVAAVLETRVAVLTAKQGLIGAAKRYVTLRSAMTILGPVIWGTLLADMLISAVGTDYARVVRAIYAFAQIRLVRAYSWDDTSQI